MRIGDLTVTPAADAEWWVGAHGPGYTVAGLVGAGFDAYARLLHPAGGGLRWADVAAATGRTLTPTTGWDDLAAGWNPDPRQSPPTPRVDGLPRRLLHRVVSVLDQQTLTPTECVFLIWEGYADLDALRGAVPEADRLHVLQPQRTYLVLRGPVTAAVTTLEDLPWGGGGRTSGGPATTPGAWAPTPI